jgi:DNA (cytosine-5)-methyltransferase 1
MLTSRGLGTVLADLASLGFDAEWGVLSAADVGANHLRERIWIVAKKQFCNSNSKDVERQWKKPGNFGSSSWWEIEPNMGRVADGMAARMDKLKAIGNGQVPLCAATAWNILKGRLN